MSGAAGEWSQVSGEMTRSPHRANMGIPPEMVVAYLRWLCGEKDGEDYKEWLMDAIRLIEQTRQDAKGDS